MLTGGTRSDSRYLAMVRRATTMPCSLRICAILPSESGRLQSSWPTPTHAASQIRGKLSFFLLEMLQAKPGYARGGRPDGTRFYDCTG